MFIVHIFVLQTKFWAGHSLSCFLDIFLAGCKIFEFSLHSVYRKVLARGQIKDLLEALEQLITHLANEAVIVFVLHMDNELPIVLAC